MSSVAGEREEDYEKSSSVTTTRPRLRELDQRSDAMAESGRLGSESVDGLLRSGGRNGSESVDELLRNTHLSEGRALTGAFRRPEASARLQTKQPDTHRQNKHPTPWLRVACNAGLAPAPGNAPTDQACVVQDRAATRHDRRGLGSIKHGVSAWRPCARGGR